MTIEAIPEERRLPVWPVVKRSYSDVWERRKLIAVPLLLAFALQFGAEICLRNIWVPPFGQIDHITTFEIYAVCFAVAIFSMSVIVGIHRTVLLGEAKMIFAFCDGIPIFSVMPEHGFY